MEAWCTAALEEVLARAVESDVHLCVADSTKLFGTVDRSILDRILNSLGLPDWFRHACSEFHAHDRLWAW